MPSLKRLIFIISLLGLLFYGGAITLVYMVRPTIVEIKQDIPLDLGKDHQQV